jgi:hypothetical protein
MRPKATLGEYHMRSAIGRWFVLLLILVLRSTTPSDAAMDAVSAQGAASAKPVQHMFVESERCIACHSNLTAPSGQDFSFGFQWRATMMAMSARDPYWRASVRRESIDHPTAIAAIEDRCSVCHMPVAHTMAVAAGEAPQLFSIQEAATKDPAATHLAMDGVTCTVCHQIKPDNFGQPESFDGGYLIGSGTGGKSRPVYGPFAVDVGRQRVMHSSTEDFLPTESAHIRQSELCATCHTLYTTALDRDGRTVGRLPEQMPYLEWQQSTYVNRESCQACHMPVVEAAAPISATLGQPRSGVAQHVFVGGNAYMLRLMNGFRADLGIVAQPQELEASALRTEQFLKTRTAQLDVGPVTRSGGRAQFRVNVRNLAGHKFPTAYPSRRAWLHVTIRDAAGKLVFESGAQRADGAIVGNDNDEDAQRFEAHHDVIRSAMDVQIYESIMVDSENRVTTSLLSGLRYVKDNRLLPAGFDKRRAGADIAVQGDASMDPDFAAGGDSVRFDVDVGTSSGPLDVRATLMFQPIGHRWAQNLKPYDAPESRVFSGYYERTAAQSATEIARASASVLQEKSAGELRPPAPPVARDALFPGERPVF